MTKLISTRTVLGICAAAILIVAAFENPAHAAKRKAPSACVVVYSADRPSARYIKEHEIAHCNGWVHAETVGFNKPGYQAPKPPAQYLHKPKMQVKYYALSTAEAKSYCGGHLGCQWFEY